MLGGGFRIYLNPSREKHRHKKCISSSDVLTPVSPSGLQTADIAQILAATRGMSVSCLQHFPLWSEPYIALVNIYYVYLPKAVGVCNNNLPCCYFYLHVIGKHYGVSLFRGCPSKIIQCNVKVEEIHQISYAMYMCRPSYNSDVNCPPTYQRKILQIISKISLLTCLKC